MNKTPTKSCGIFIFNHKKEVLLILTPGAYNWITPCWNHSYNANHLEVAMQGVFEYTGIDFFNYDEKYFKPIKYSTNNNEIFVPFVIYGEKTLDIIEPWVDIEEWDYVPVKDALEILKPSHKFALKELL